MTDDTLLTSVCLVKKFSHRRSQHKKAPIFSHLINIPVAFLMSPPPQIRTFLTSESQEVQDERHFSSILYILLIKVLTGPGSVVVIATGYGLDCPRIKSRCGARFYTPVQTSPEAHPASCTMGTGFFQGVKRSRGVTLTPHCLLVPWS